MVSEQLFRLMSWSFGIVACEAHCFMSVHIMFLASVQAVVMLYQMRFAVFSYIEQFFGFTIIVTIRCDENL